MSLLHLKTCIYIINIYHSERETSAQKRAVLTVVWLSFGVFKTVPTTWYNSGLVCEKFFECLCV